MNARFIVFFIGVIIEAIAMTDAAIAQSPAGTTDCTPLSPGCYKPTLPKECSDYEVTLIGRCGDAFCKYQTLRSGIIINLGCANQVAQRYVGPELFYLSRVRFTNPSVGGEAPEHGFDRVNCTKTHCLILQECLGCIDPLTQLYCQTEGEEPDQSGPKSYTQMVPAGDFCVPGNSNVPNHPDSGNPVPAPEDGPIVVGDPTVPGM